MSQRVSILKHWINGNRNGESFLNTVKTVFSLRCNIKAKKYVESIEVDGDYRKIKIAGISTPLYFPLCVNEIFAYEVIVELFNKSHWHCYITPETDIESDDIVVDCGAAEGLFSLFASGKCKMVYAIEPLPMFINSMERTFAEVENVTIMPCAVSDKPGSAFIVQDSDGISSKVISTEDNAIPIEIKTIDELFANKKITYIKGDLEGYDYLTLLGAKDTIMRNKPKIAITTYHNKEHAAQMIEYLKSIVPEYNIKIKGIEHKYGAPMMLHAWT